MSGSGKRKPLIKAKQLLWWTGNRTGEIQHCCPAVFLKISVCFGRVHVVLGEHLDTRSLLVKEFEGKGKTERAKAYAQKWWNRFVRSLRSGLEVKVE